MPAFLGGCIAVDGITRGVVDQYLLHHRRNPVGGNQDDGQFEGDVSHQHLSTRGGGYPDVSKMDRSDPRSAGVRNSIVHVPMGTVVRAGRGSFSTGLVWAERWGIVRVPRSFLDPLCDCRPLRTIHESIACPNNQGRGSLSPTSFLGTGDAPCHDVTAFAF